jgi:hypothetical protein
MKLMSRTIVLGALALFMALALTGCQAQCPVPSPASEPAEQTAAKESPPKDIGGAVNLSDLRAMALYENLANGFNISYPEEWIAKEPEANQQGIVAGFLAPGEDVNSPEIYMFVQVESLPAGQKVSLDQYTQALMQILKKDASQIKILTDDGITLGNLSSHAIVYNIESDRRSFRVIKTWTLANDRAFIFTYNAPDDRYEEFSADVSSMLKSFYVT